MGKDDIVWHEGGITKSDRQKMNNHKSAVIWFTGLSGSGKSTVAAALEQTLSNMSIRTYVLDGDNIRHGLNKDLGFSKEDRAENIRRIGEISKLFVDAGIMTLAAFISPYQKDRNAVRSLLEAHEFIEVYVKCDLKECEKRDPKGLYKKVRNGEITGFTGVDAPYEEPGNPEIIIETDRMSVDECVDKILNYLQKNGYLNLSS